MPQDPHVIDFDQRFASDSNKRTIIMTSVMTSVESLFSPVGLPPDFPGKTVIGALC